MLSVKANGEIVDIIWPRLAIQGSNCSIPDTDINWVRLPVDAPVVLQMDRRKCSTQISARIAFDNDPVYASHPNAVRQATKNSRCASDDKPCVAIPVWSFQFASLNVWLVFVASQNQMKIELS